MIATLRLILKEGDTGSFNLQIPGHADRILEINSKDIAEIRGSLEDAAIKKALALCEYLDLTNIHSVKLINP